MKILEFRKHHVVQDIITTLQDDEDEIVEAIVIGKRKSGGRFSYMTVSDNIPELIGYLEAIKTDLALQLAELAERYEE